MNISEREMRETAFLFFIYNHSDRIKIKFSKLIFCIVNSSIFEKHEVLFHGLEIADPIKKFNIVINTLDM
ncbi:hypothetical protein CCY01nite_30060 [Chitinophaga cymbidii]|uniref:Uncharacterized protein n=1 Tax=Chitinophaga cymbidii TaxID=1096750 RepID=A0A512RM28_9BACT|nr:hypothetical protein CCY01nite_30060 [Chitinophaga cymbidii]